MSERLHELLIRPSDDSPSAPAVVQEDRTITYRELDSRSNQVAHVLIGLGFQPGDRACLFLDKSIEAIVAVYGILKAGGAYVPLDPDSPLTRASQILRDSQPRVLLSAAGKQRHWAELTEGSDAEHVVVLNEGTFAGPPDLPVTGAAEIDKANPTAPDVTVSPHDLAYILYTSGSTGTPKGVMLSHENALSFVRWAVGRFGVGSDDVLSSHAPLHFDLSIFDLFAASAAGAPVSLVPSEAYMFPASLRSFIQDAGITTWYSVPSALVFLLLRGGLRPGDLPSLRTVLFAGEVFPSTHLAELMHRIPHARFANLYGPTETNVCTFYEVPEHPSEDADIPIGVPIDGVDVIVADEGGRELPDGEIGELHVAGPTVMHGYWNDPTKSSEALYLDAAGRRVYRTGDLGRRREDGNIAFLGRNDLQIKRRGYRIELGEIESVMNSHSSVIESAASPTPDELISNRIRVDVVAKKGADPEQLWQHLRDHLPAYMVPDVLELHEDLPKTSTGKIDRQALRQVKAEES